MKLIGGTFTAPNTHRFEAAPLHPDWFEILGDDFIPVTRITSDGGTTPDVVDDTNVLQHTDATTVLDYDIPLQFTDRYLKGLTVSITSDDLSRATIEGNRIVHQDVGSVTITVTSDSRTWDKSVTMTEQTESATEFVSWVDGSLAKYCSDAVDTRLAGKSPASALRVYTTQDHENAVYLRNPNLWCADLAQKLTCISPWNSTGANKRAGVALTPRHVAYAPHYPLAAGSPIRFVAANGTVHTRTILAVKKHPLFRGQAGGYRYDIAIAVLDSDLPQTITPCHVSPATLTDYLPSIQRGIAAFGMDQEEKALVRDVYYAAEVASFRAPADAKRLEFFENIIGGDSGNPAFLIINNDLVLTNVWTLGEGGTGTHFGSEIPAINQLIADVDALAGNGATGYTVTHPDLTAFPIY